MYCSNKYLFVGFLVDPDVAGQEDPVTCGVVATGPRAANRRRRSGRFALHRRNRTGELRRAETVSNWDRTQETRGGQFLVTIPTIDLG